MAPGQIVAYKRLWSGNFSGRETQIPRSALHQRFPSPHQCERSSQGEQNSGDRFTSLSGIKNCPTNGGKLIICLTPAITGLHCGAKRRLRRSGAWPCWAVFLPLLLFYF